MEKWWVNVRTTDSINTVVKYLMKKNFFFIFYFFGLFALFALPTYFLIENIKVQNIATGFHFFNLEAGFEISESILDYNSYMNYGRALLAGVVNTVYVAIIGNVFALILGILLGVFSLSGNFLLSKFCFLYLNFFRNIPLLLQLFFWYGIFTDVLPAVKRATPFFGFIASNRGLAVPWFSSSWAIILILMTIFITTAFIVVLNYWTKKLLGNL